MTFDSGPGQIMLKERDFYTAVDSGTPPKPLSAEEKVTRLVELMRDGDNRLAINREIRRKKFEKLVEAYHATPGRVIDQTGIRLA